MDDLDLGATIKGFVAGQKIFGRYTLKRLLGRGGMGVVWLARDEKLDEDVALKFLPDVVKHDAAALDELKAETKRARRLTHAGIVRIHDFLDDTHAAAIAMEAVDGVTLSQLRIEQPGKIFEAAALTGWLRQLCAALDYAHHTAKVVHRDLKPANLMVDRSDHIKITDFGIARSISDSVSRASAQAGSSGTPAYMSPQQMLGEKPAVTDDIYGLGATIYELLTGKPPFHSGNVLLQVQSKVPPAIAERRRELEVSGAPIPPEWETVIAACLAKEPQDRPQSAGEVVERLGLTTKDHPSPKLRPAGTKPGAPATTPRTNPATPGVSADQPPKPKSKVGLYAGLAAGVLLLAGAGYYFGVYVPEQARLAEIKRLETQARSEADAKERARLEAEALKLKNDQERTAAEARAKAEQQRLAAEHLAAARGGIAIRTTPAGAEVRVGAIALEKSPLTLKDQKLGKYPVRVRAEGYEDWTGEVEVKENDFAELDVTLVRSTGTVTFTTDPAGLEAEISGQKPEDGGQKVRTPGSLKLPTGSYEVTFRRPGWPEQKQTVVVTRNRSTSAAADFAAGALELTSTPAGAEVWQNGKRLGTTPFQVSDTIPGRYDFELQLKGYKAASAGVTVTARQTARDTVALEQQLFPQFGQTRENTLGMKFVPVPGVDALFGVWDVRVQDYQAFSDETRHEWSKPGFEQGSMHPAVNVSWDDAQAFCAWLTKKEQAAGRLGPDQKYRLPTDAEWSVAVGLEEPVGDTPQSKDDQIKGIYPWGTQWPPPRGAGNYAASLNVDDYANTSPVGSFAANKFGLYDMGGNVWQWCEDFYNGSNGGHVLRGASFRNDYPDSLRSSNRGNGTPDSRYNDFGFRVVVAVGGSSQNKVARSAAGGDVGQASNRASASSPLDAQETMKLAHELFAFYLSSFKDQGLITRLLTMPASLVRDAASLSILSNSDRQNLESNLAKRVMDLSNRPGNPVGIAQEAQDLTGEIFALYLSSFNDQEIKARLPSLPASILRAVDVYRGLGSSDRQKTEERLVDRLNDLDGRLGPTSPTSKGEAGVAPERPAGLPDALNAADLDQLPVPRYQVRPEYPFELHRAGITGEVTVEFIVTASGDVVGARAVQSTNKGFEAAAMQAVSQWKFRPGRKGGRVVNTRMQVPLVFSLTDDK